MINKEAFDISNMSANNDLDAFIMVNDSRRYIKHYATGFSCIDDVTSGGLEEGFGILCGVSSVGKTTLLTQIAYNMSKAGTPVIMFSLEQDVNALLSKMVSMQSYQDGRSKFLASEILREGTMERRDQEVINDYQTSVRRCQENAKNIIIVDRSRAKQSINSQFIVDFVTEYMSQTGNKPVVFVDYLQRLSPNEGFESSQKMAVIDNNTETLWDFAHIHKLCICAISSLNRESYKNGATLEGQKGSGNIEYSADWGFGIQFQGFDQADFNFNEAKSKYNRDVEVVVLKQRLGSSGIALPFVYTPAYNVFLPVSEKEVFISSSSSENIQVCEAPKTVVPVAKEPDSETQPATLPMDINPFAVPQKIDFSFSA